MSGSASCWCPGGRSAPQQGGGNEGRRGSEGNWGDGDLTHSTSDACSEWQTREPEGRTPGSPPCCWMTVGGQRWGWRIRGLRAEVSERGRIRWAAPKRCFGSEAGSPGMWGAEQLPPQELVWEDLRG